MTTTTTTTFGWFLETPGAPLVQRELVLPAPSPTEVVVRVRGCGLCHTDLGFASGETPPRHALPLVLGHEIVGDVVAAGDPSSPLLGRTVIVPAVLPCGACELCARGRGNACTRQTMPGNDAHGGFAGHVLVAAAPLVAIDPPSEEKDLLSLAVVADAVSTAYQATRRAELLAGDVAIVVGAGGVGGYVAQIARALGASVVAVDVSRQRLDKLAGFGVDRRVAVDGRGVKELRKEIGGIVKDASAPSHRHKIFECSGTPQGQQLAFALLGRASTLVQVGYTPQAVELRLSNLMAHDATVHGSWGCPPEAYAAVLGLIAKGEVAVAPFVEVAPMSRLNDLLDDMAHHRLEQRMVLTP